MKKYFYFAVLTLAAILPNFSQSQTIIDYDRATFTGTYQTITGTPGPSGDDYAENYNLPFTFYYINHDYNQVRICTNGWIELGSATRPLSYSYSLSNEELFSIYEPNKTLAPWWDDISAYNYPVEYTTLGSFPNRVFVVQWRDVNSPLGSERYVNFQLRLYETTNIIEFWYGGVSGSGNIEYASFGIEDEIGGTNHFIDGPTGSNTVGTTDLNSYDNWPTVFYRFSPLPVKVVRPNGGEFFSIGYADTIKWSSTVSDIKLEYSTDSGNNWNIIENSVPAVTGKYEWLVPNTPSENSLVRISDATNPSVFDVSNGVFTISEPPVITVLPDSFYFVLNEGDSTESIMQILDSGLGNLFYEISIENVSDQSKRFNRSSFLNSSTMWRESFLKAQEHRDKNFKRNITDYIFPELVLPLIISDPAGDASIVDIVQIRGRSTADSIQLELVFETDLNPFDFGGLLGIDIDQDVLTGIPLPYGLPEQEVGCEYYAQLAIGSNLVYVYDQFNNYVGSFPVGYDLLSFRFSIPLSFLSNDDGVMNLAAVVGNGSGPTDWIPDQGYGVLGGNLWLTINPLSGIISPGGSENIIVKVNTDKIDGGEFYANILVSSNDPVNQLVIIPVHLTVIGQPNLVAPDSVIFGEVFVGYPETVIAELRNTGSVTVEVSDIQTSNPVFSIQGNSSFSIEPLGVHELSVLFGPAAAGLENGILSIISNDPSSPEIINLTGEGIFPPVITVTPDSFFYNLNVGDSVITQLNIDNSNGLGELVFQISDRLVAGGTKSKNPAQNYIKHKNALVERNKLFGIEPKSLSILNSEMRVTTNLSTRPAVDNLMPSLPLIVQDVIGDGGVADIKEIRGRVFNNNLEVEYVFADGININDSLIAVLYLDTDRNPLTGATDPIYYHDLGVDYFVDYYPLGFGNEIYISEYSTGNSYTIPYIINGTTISYSIPLSLLSNDDGEMDLLAVSGYTNLDALDWAPDIGHATLFGDVSWLTENPISGIIPPGGNMTIEIRANTSELIGGNYLAAIDVQSNDPANPVVKIPFALHLTGIPQIFVSPDSLNFGETYIGYYQSLNLSISSTGTDSLFGNIFSSDPQFVLMDSTFALPVGELKNVEVQFRPDAVGIVSAELTISSNASLIPLIISLTGEGVVAPNISTDTSFLEFHAGTEDTLHSNFVIYNTGGSDLTVEISDKVTDKVSGSERLFGTGSNMIYEINPDDGQIINSFPSPVFTSEGPTGLAYSGDYLFFTDAFSDYSIYVLNPENGGLITSFPAPSTSSDGLAFIDPYLYVNDYNYGYIYVVDPLRGMIQDTLYPPVYVGGGLDGGNDRLFASNGNSLCELNPENGLLISSFFTINSIYGIGFTGEKIFSSIPGTGIDEYDPDTGIFIKSISTTGYAALAGGGKRDAEWLIENPVQVTIPAGDSVSISLFIISPDESGLYTAEIILNSNDPDSAVTRLQVVLDVITGVDEENSLPTVYSLYNNYPNPFNPATNIKYDIPEQSYVTIKIYNIVGEEITTLINEEQNAGRYQIQWTAANLPSGVYFYRLQAGEYIEIKKMLLLK